MNAESNDKPYNKPGPTGEAKWAEKTVLGIVVGRDKTIVPPADVEHFASLGCTDREIAKYFDISESTLRYNFSSFLTKGRHQLKTTLRQAQLRYALEGNATLLVWLGKNLLSQSDSGTMNDDKRPLPWTDDMDDDTTEDDDSYTKVVEGELDADTET
jgi:hypothetical protein